ncbi:MAG TPA: S-layer homology domain-containing protein [Spirochaetia bacterium]|nr:S-layer homology domain-containing protein [Spirochaetia bacterium]
MGRENTHSGSDCGGGEPGALAVQAAGVTLDLGITSAAAGATVGYTGTAAPGVMVPIKILDPSGDIVFYDEVAADTQGDYSGSFVVLAVAPETLTVVVGYGTDVADASLIVASGGGGTAATPQASTSTTGSASVSPSAGGTAGLEGSATLDIPAGALQGTANATVSVQAVSSPPAPSGFMIQGQVYQFTMNGQGHYSFSSPVTLTFTFDPTRLPPSSKPAVFYYDATGKWVDIGGTVDWTHDTITVTVNHFTEYAVMVSTQPAVQTVKLTDIAGNWAYASIEKLVSLGTITGYPDGTFRPNNDITRAEFVTALVKALKLAPKSGPIFVDTQGSWAQSYISTAAADGIVAGYNATHFGPNDLISREQMTAMVVRAAKLTPVPGELTFKDAAQIDPWARWYVVTAVKDGIVNGYPDGTFRPLSYATRAEAVTVIAEIVK